MAIQSGIAGALVAFMLWEIGDRRLELGDSSLFSPRQNVTATRTAGGVPSENHQMDSPLIPA